MHAGELLVGDFRRLDFVQFVVQLRGHQLVTDGNQPLGAFRMAGPHFVFAAVRVGEIACFAHSEIPVSLFSDNVTPCMHS